MAVASSEVAGKIQSPSLPEATHSAISSPSTSTSIHHEVRPIDPLEPPDPGPEPVYGSVTAKQWEIWVAQKEEYVMYAQRRKKSEIYAAENDLRGTF